MNRRRGGTATSAISFAIVLAGTAAPAVARAQGNYRLAPVGGRTTLVGGTGVAFGADSASAFLNPATAVRVDDSRLSFSVNFYTMKWVYSPGWYRPGPVDTARFGQLDPGDATRSDIEFNALPSSLCFFFKLGELPSSNARIPEDPRARAAKLGLCFASIQGSSFGFAAGQYDHTSSTGSVTYHAQTVSQSFNRFAFGPTFAASLSESFAIGASVHASFASHRSVFTAAANTFGGGVPAATSSLFASGARGDSFQGTATAGFWWKLGVPTIGFAVESPSLHLYGVSAANLSTTFEAGGTTGASTTSVNGSFTSKTPLRLSLGAGIEDKWGNGEIDVSYYLPQSSAYSAVMDGRQLDRNGANIVDVPTKVVLSERASGVIGVGAGAEIYVARKLSLLGGLGLDLSAVPDGKLQGTLLNYYAERTQRVSASFGLGSHGEGGDLLFGTELSIAFGDRLAVNSYQLPPTMAVTPHQTVQLLFVIAGSTSLKSISRAVKDVQNVINDDKK